MRFIPRPTRQTVKALWATFLLYALIVGLALAMILVRDGDQQARGWLFLVAITAITYWRFRKAYEDKPEQ